ncbi:MAG: GyrI-like domain-containing protein, partial [Longimicrobiales bacterium]
EGEVKADVLPAGEMLNFIHRGPYPKLRISYGEMMKYLDAKSMTVGAPTWEIYLNDPDSVSSEDELETDIYVTIGAT